MVKLGILTTHPIQYQATWFRLLAARPEIDLTVFFAMLPDEKQQGDGFGVAFKWDIPLLEGYRYRLLENISPFPSVTTFRGCDTPGIAPLVRDEGFDAFIVNGWVARSCMQLLTACRRYRIPCIVRGESNSLRPRAWWKKLLHRRLLARYSAFLSIGIANREFYRQNGVGSEKIFFAPYCVENDRFEHAVETLRPQRDELRRSWGIPQKAATFLFCGKFIDKKRPMDILKALRLLVNQQSLLAGRAIHLLMVGSGELLNRCKAFAVTFDLPVTFVGFLNQSDIPKAYVAVDCQILPSDNGETWGLVVNEGMACALPAIVSDQVGCHLDLITPGETGEVFPLGDIETLAEKMRLICVDTALRYCMGQGAQERVAGYCYEEVVRGTEAALDYVLRCRGRSRAV